MDADRFDRLAQSLSRSRSRRGALQTLSGLLLGVAGGGWQVASGKERHKGRDAARGHGRHDRRKGKARIQAKATACFTGTNCAPGPGKNLAKCDYAGSATLQGQNLKGANLGGANLRGADASGVDFSRANLGGACLVDANLTNATLTGANLGSAVFCRTVMPNGTVNNSGCTAGSTCCPTCIPLGEGRCALGGSCCGGGVCAEDGRCACPNGQANCGGTCRNVQSDAKNCGACGAVCPSGERCQGGQCRCGDNATCGQGLTCCSGSCVDLLTDLDNCTECGNTCPAELAHADVFCGEAQDDNGNPGYGCAYECKNNEVANCSGDPLTGCETQISSDPKNCGKCGFSCPAATPRCCGCKCFTAESTLCAKCQDLTTARLIRRR